MPLNNNNQLVAETQDKDIRSELIDLESALKSLDNSVVGDSEICPLKHSFTDHIYIREIFIPAGTLLVGKIHKHEHPNFLMSGEVVVVTQDKGKQILKAPLSMISKAGTKRALYAVTDLVWITVHYNPKNTQDLKELEDYIIAKDYAELDQFLNKSILNRLKLFIKKLNI